ncbi:helix-turn-helix domain-containing protein [Streptomyces violaceoruber]|uniref:helix-turn-helix domain-containing protein n=1 Tax=Streptomyces violaceoruber group TaxID=2867121 RepID=UPI0033F85956
MTRLNTSVSAEELYAVLTNPDIGHGAKAVWSYLHISSDPQSQRGIAQAIHMDPATVSRLMKALEAVGLARRVHGVWLPESPAPKGEGR